MTAPSSTVAKAFEILELFRSYSLVSASQCERTLGMPRSTAHRLLVSLAAVGAVEPMSHGHYRLSLTLFELGALAPRRRDLGDRCGSQLEALADRTGGRIHMGVRRAHRVLYLETAHGRRARAQNMRTPSGYRGPLHATALGKVLLAYAPEETVDEVLAKDLAAYTPLTVTDPAALRDRLAAIRARAYEYSCEEYVVGSSSVAVPIRDPNGHVNAALAIAMDTAQMSAAVQSLLADARRAALNIERGIGIPSSRRWSRRRPHRRAAGRDPVV